VCGAGEGEGVWVCRVGEDGCEDGCEGVQGGCARWCGAVGMVGVCGGVRSGRDTAPSAFSPAPPFSKQAVTRTPAHTRTSAHARQLRAANNTPSPAAHPTQHQTKDGAFHQCSPLFANSFPRPPPNATGRFTLSGAHTTTTGKEKERDCASSDRFLMALQA